MKTTSGLRSLKKEISDLKKENSDLCLLNASMKKAARALQTIKSCDEVLVRASNEQTLLDLICKVIIREEGYLLAWIGYAENDSYRSVRPVAQAGYEEGYLEAVKLTWADTERGRGPTGTSIRTGKTVTSRNMLTDPSMAIFRDEIIKRGYASSIAIPLKASGNTIGSLQIYAKEPDSFDGQEIELLESLAKKVVYGILSLRARDEKAAAERKLEESHNLLHAIIQGTTDSIYVKDREGRYLMINSTTARMMGITEEELIGNNAMKSISPETRRKFREDDERILKSGRTATFEINVTIKGEERIYSTTKGPVRDGAGRIIGVFGISRDITEMKKMEEELGKIQKLESLGVLAGGIAHDFNNILTGILGNISIAKSLLDPSGRSYLRLEEAEKASLRATELANQLLTFAKGGAPVKSVASVREVIESSVAFVLRGSKIRSRLLLRNDLWPVEIDIGQITQVIQNLLINARQAMPEGGVIEVSARNMQVGEGSPESETFRKGRYLEIAVRDEGQGIPKEVLPRIFDPYFTTKEKGSGLGLAISHSIIHRHEGYLRVESKIGEGTTFFLCLPASPEAVISESPDHEPMEPGSGSVLVMDDEESVLTVAHEMIRELGYRVDLARKGDEVISKYRNAMEAGKPFDLVITDLTLPDDMSGVDVLKKLKALNPKVKVIVSSGYSNDPILKDYQHYGFKDYLAKPYRLEKLSAVLKNALRKK